jgi:hypothetical protein
MGHYDIAEICMAGHETTDGVRQHPARTSPFCPDCGEPTIRGCPQCKVPIRGDFVPSGRGWRVISPYTPPNYCHGCGAAFPWTVRRLAAATALSRESGVLTAEEAAQFESDLGHVSRDTPETPVAASRIKRFLKKLGVESGPALTKVLTDVATDAAKKLLFP